MGERRPYAISRFENNVDYIPEHVTGPFDIPVIDPEPYVYADYIPFHQAGSTWYKREERGIHFFISDYEFQSLWYAREKYREMLTQYCAVMTPDFSLYTDWPIMVQMWNHYRKHQLGAWMQSIGCRVYPTITWSDEKSYPFCFAGEPHHATVCVSSVGTQKNKHTKRLFLQGYDKMMEVLEPELILFYGLIPDECSGNIIQIDAYKERYERWRK